jgi:hypothetical protein
MELLGRFITFLFLLETLSTLPKFYLKFYKDNRYPILLIQAAISFVSGYPHHSSSLCVKSASAVDDFL